MSDISIDVTMEAGNWPPGETIEEWIRRAFAAIVAETGLTIPRQGTELSAVFTDDAHIRQLNREWRGKDKSTNVLSFPAFAPNKAGPISPMLGDIVLAWQTVAREADADGKSIDQHSMHLIVHGILHLIGYDHELDDEAEEMEALERRILSRLAIPDPYA